MNNLHREIEKKLNNPEWTKNTALNVLKKREQKLIKRSKVLFYTALILVFFISLGLISSNMNMLEAEETDPIDIIINAFSEADVYNEIDNFIEIAFKE